MLNKSLFLPLMLEAGVRVEYREYPGYGHGFYVGEGDGRWDKGADEAVVEQVIRDTHEFFPKRCEQQTSCLAKIRVPRVRNSEASSIQKAPPGIRNSMRNVAPSHNGSAESMELP